MNEEMKTDDIRAHTPDSMEERILQEAGKLFVEKGFSGASTTEIARNAGCNQALVHYYFRTKRNLFDRFFEQMAKQVFSDIVSVEAGEGTFTEKLSRIIGIHFDIIRRNSSLVLFLINEVSRDPSRLMQIRNSLGHLPDEAFVKFRQVLAEEAVAGNIRHIDIVDLILNIISLNVFVFVVKPVFGQVWKVGGGDMDRFLDHRRQEIIDTVLQSLRPVEQ